MMLKVISVYGAMVLCNRALFTEAASSQFGKRFLLAFPQLTLDISVTRIIVFYFPTLRDCVVDVTTPFFGEQTLNVKVHTSRHATGTLMLNETYNFIKETGTKPSVKLTSTEDFIVICYVMDDDYHVESFTGLPIDGWGKTYFVATSTSFPSLQVVTENGPNLVSVYLRVSQPKAAFFIYKLNKYVDKGVIKAELLPLEALSIAQCANVSETGSLTGTKIVGSYPIGVISGNCYSRIESLDCDQWDKNVTSTPTTRGTNYIVETMLPAETYGLEFVTFGRLRGRMTPPVFMMIASEGNTEVTLFKLQSLNDEKFLLKSEGDWDILPVVSDNHLVKSNKPILFIVFDRSPCLSSIGNSIPESGGPGLAYLVPNNLFVHSYLWRTLDFKMLTINHFMIIIWDTGSSPLIYDNKLLEKPIQMEKVLGKVTWSVSYYYVHAGTHDIHGKNTVPFGMYLYGIGPEFTYLNIAGFISSPINEPCTHTPVVVMDLIDNDCDGMIDEELEDENDNDADSLIDEDLTIASRIDGQWSEWTEWWCERNCSDKRMYRSRFCNNPPPSRDGADCEGKINDTLLGVCYLDISVDNRCPTDCLDFEWGSNCVKSCRNCQKACDKFTGVCTSCASGFQLPMNSCNTACGINTYGLGCKFKCNEKCAGLDCVERVHGGCQESGFRRKGTTKFAIVFLIFTLLLVPTFIYWWGKRIETKPDDFSSTSDATGMSHARSYVSHSSSMGSSSGNASF